MNGLQEYPVERIEKGFGEPLGQRYFQSNLKEEKCNDGNRDGEET